MLACAWGSVGAGVRQPTLLRQHFTQGDDPVMPVYPILSAGQVQRSTVQYSTVICYRMAADFRAYLLIRTSEYTRAWGRQLDWGREP